MDELSSEVVLQTDSQAELTRDVELRLQKILSDIQEVNKQSHADVCSVEEHFDKVIRELISEVEMKVLQVQVLYMCLFRF